MVLLKERLNIDFIWNQIYENQNLISLPVWILLFKVNAFTSSGDYNRAL